MEMGMLGLRGDVLLVAPASFHHDSLLTTEHPIIPLLTSTPLDDNQRAKAPAGIQFWQPQSQPVQQHLQNPNPNPNPSLSYLKKPVAMLDAAGFLTGGGHSTCQDCGNQAKKDCIHHRCRTCCKSRGFNCSTHVKSTWVPAARRRERQQFSGAGAGAGSSASASTSAPKKPRLISSQTTTTTSTSNTTPPRSIDTTSSHQDPSFRENLPGHVRAPAVFKCVRVTSIDDGEDEYAYQAMVRIGGHMFKGFLYDQGEDTGRGGEDDTRIAATGDNNNSTIPNMSELNLGGAGRNGASSSSGMLQADLYGGSGFLGGTSYGNQIN